MKTERRKYELIFVVATLFLLCLVTSAQAADMGEIRSGETRTENITLDIIGGYDSNRVAVREHQLEQPGIYTVVTSASWANGTSKTGKYALSLAKIPATLPPGIYHPFPAKGATITDLKQSFTWDVVSGATGYDLYFGEDVVAPREKIGENLTSLEMSFPVMEWDKVYYWHVGAHLPYGTIQGPYWWFKTTSSEPIPPIVMTENATNVSSATATLNMAFEFNDYSAVQVQFQYKAEGASAWNTTGWVSRNGSGAHTYAEQIANLSANRTYYFSALLQYDCTYVRNGTVVSFTTTPAANLGEVITNTIGMEFVPIAAGEFEMGSPSDEEGMFSYEGPVHHVNIEKAFYMGRYEVTQKQWRAIMGNNLSFFKGDYLPVEQVSWDDVQEFIRKLNEKEETDKYRLPSEAEWEYACRAGTTTRYSFGDDDTNLGDYAWYYSNSGSQTHPVGQKKANPWGLYDMHGNVWEWVQDKWHSNYEGAPANGSAWDGFGALRVIRGGYWGNLAWNCRSAYRALRGPNVHSYSLGFRILKEQ